MKCIKVVAAIIVKDNQVLATQRGYGEFKGGWEFPGGKIEPYESKEEAIKREIKEELMVDIEVGEHLALVEYNYPNFHLEMDCFICEMVDGTINLVEHQQAKWLDVNHLHSVEWLAADVSLIPEIEEYLKKHV